MTTESANLRAPNKSFSAKLTREIKGNLKIMSETKEEKLEAAEVQSGENIELPKELTVCGIIGEWGAYQLSVTLFGIIYSAILSTSVVVGPMWTPDIRHICAPLATSGGGANATATSALLDSIDFASNPHQCQQVASSVETSSGRPLMVECERFIYDDQQYGQVLTNSFDLVCNRQWLRSTLSSAALTGMLVSSVTLGLISDKYGRMCCIQVGFVISLLTTIGAILAQNYLLLNGLFMLMSLAQVGVANALSTLVMEATSPRYRFVSVFEYGFGWGLGLLVVPMLNALTRNYRHFLLASLGLQLFMLVWCRFGVFESIRWLLSEGKINQAQIELRRACRINRVKNGTELAHRIACVQVNQMRKASRVIEAKIGLNEGLLTQAIRRSFLLTTPDGRDNQSVGGTTVKMSICEGENNVQPETGLQQQQQQPETVIKSRSNSVLSPTLARKSFSLDSANNKLPGEQVEMVDLGDDSSSYYDEKLYDSITNKAAMHLVLQYSKILQEKDEGTCFLVRMFHRKLYKTTLMLSIISIMLETSYYGLIQATGIVGNDVEFNYVIGALSEWLAAVLYVLTLWLLSRRAALIVPISLSSIVCLAMASSYYLIPNSLPTNLSSFNQTVLIEATDGQLILSEPSASITNQTIIFNDGSSPEKISIPTSASGIHLDNSAQEHQLLIDLRERINVGLMTLGKLLVTVAIQIAATITMESYPNNLRQSGAGVILIVGRTCSVVAPFLFGDHSSEKFVLQITLAVLGAFGFIVCMLVPCLLRETKDLELCDRLNDIEDQDED